MMFLVGWLSFGSMVAMGRREYECLGDWGDVFLLRLITKRYGLVFMWRFDLFSVISCSLFLNVMDV